MIPGPDDLADKARERGRLSPTPALMLGQEPVPAPLPVLGAVLLRIDDDETMPVRRLAHTCGRCERLRALRAPVQHQDERDGGLGIDAGRRMNVRTQRPITRCELAEDLRVRRMAKQRPRRRRED